MFLAHAEFKNSNFPISSKRDAFHKQCKAEVDAIAIFFPGIQDEGIRISFAAWLAFACAMDDILETLSPEVGKAVLRECVKIAQGLPESSPTRGAYFRLTDTA